LSEGCRVPNRKKRKKRGIEVADTDAGEKEEDQLSS